MRACMPNGSMDAASLLGRTQYKIEIREIISKKLKNASITNDLTNLRAAVVEYNTNGVAK